MLRAMRTAGGPYSVTSHSLSIALNALNADDLLLRNYVDSIRRERDRFCTLLSGLNVYAIRSEANFVLLQSTSVDSYDRIMGEFGISTRAFPRDPDIADMRRVTMPGDEIAFNKLQQAITAAFTTVSQ